MFDPCISSSGYLTLARERDRAGTSKLNEDLSQMLDDDYACGLTQEHIDVLIYPANWSAVARHEHRPPRVFLNSRINQKGNAEIGWARGELDLLYPEDFLTRYVVAAQSAGSVPWRGIGELMWWKGFELLVSNAIIHRSPVATALLYAHAASLNELASVLAQHVNLVGAMALKFTYQDGEITSADFVPTIPPDRLREMIQERGRRKAATLREAVERIAKFDPEEPE
ncbi:hypothetical protein EN829_023435 [Mesorhizobium sp. M00.F.Ca.ET.186.01.1.1]|nr:hypothetical protein EN848_18500 [bacterium M00.F.Ca.ET.205.01.1.1]TGU51740.1 hypothetical protein EN795_18050 [bacterium M00.F.Ca.ET.152.01.1.1]TGV33139.1 hypothetical protein EN829_023435 [Mesorhizobium sp. M00.F.Ca.ET.186.01.1.1]TGZ42279.1 hypothetical protein EN805_13780 [bacterium M00.F.Ca.ET.162.01.1.1]